MTHCVQQGNYKIPSGSDYIINVSSASKKSFGDDCKDGIVIHNLTAPEKPKKALFLVSACRAAANDKQGNDKRCVKLARMLEKADIPYIWIHFGNAPMKDAPEKMIYGGLVDDIRPYIAKADYLVQLSGVEAFSYSLLESLEEHTPVIVTPLAQNDEMGIIDGKNAYIVPFEVDGFDATKLLNVPKFTYWHDNERIINQWRDILGDTTPKLNYQPKKEVEVIVTVQYRDMQRDEMMKIGDKFTVNMRRALQLQGLGFVRIMN
jgi:hypothetical protein